MVFIITIKWYFAVKLRIIFVSFKTQMQSKLWFNWLTQTLIQFSIVMWKQYERFSGFFIWEENLYNNWISISIITLHSKWISFQIYWLIADSMAENKTKPKDKSLIYIQKNTLKHSENQWESRKFNRYPAHPETEKLNISWILTISFSENDGN